jgi:hypothetical protein
MKQFYVYIYFDPRLKDDYTILDEVFNYKPVYVGKGQNNRVLKHINCKRKTRLVNLNQHLIKEGLVPCYRILKHFEKEEDALALEVELIKKIGREDLNLGPLFNLTDGGEGTSGAIASRELLETRKNNTKAFWDSLSSEERKIVGEKSLANRNPENVEKGRLCGMKVKSEWSLSRKREVEDKRKTHWQKTYCNTIEKKEQRKTKCKQASLKRLMFYLAYLKEDGTLHCAYLKDLIACGWGKDALEWRIKGKTPFESPYFVKVNKETVILKKVEKRPYLRD